MDEQLPVKTDQPTEDERTWRDVAGRWKEVGRQIKDLGERLGTAFREGWETEDVEDEEARRLVDKMRELGERMDRAVDAVREEARNADTKAKAKQTMRTTREASTELLGELQETLSEGLEEVSRRVDDLAKKRQEKKGKGDPGA